MKKFLAFLLALTMVLGLVPAMAEEEITLSILFHFKEELVADVIKGFEESHPGVKIDYTYVQITDEELVTRLVGGEHWDVLNMPTVIPNSELSNYFLPLGTPEEWADEFFFTDYKAYEGTTYGLPIGGVYEGLMYNQQVMDQYNNGEVPKTIDEFMALCQVLEDNGVTPVWSNGGNGWALRYWTHLAATIAEDADYANKVSLAKDPWAEGTALRQANAYLETFAKEGWLEADVVTSNQWDTSTASLSLGQTGFILTGTWAVDNARIMAESLGVDPQNIKFAAFPYKNDVSAENPLWLRMGEDLFSGVGKNTQHPELAKELLSYFMGHVSNKIGMNSANKVYGTPSESVSYLADIDYYTTYSPTANDLTIQTYANNCGIDLYAYDNYLLDYVILPVLNGGESNWDGLNAAWNTNFQ